MLFRRKPKGLERKVITTMPPYAPYMREVARHPVVSGVRLNTVMPLKDTIENELARMRKQVGHNDFWIDLKGRQLRTTQFASPPYRELTLSHEIQVNTPCKVYFNDGIDEGTAAEVDGNRLIMLDGPQKLIGPGESVNIVDPSLRIKGYLTENDQNYIRVARSLGMHQYMLSYVEKESDLTDVLELDPEARIVAKIESEKGLEFVDRDYPKYRGQVRLMAARGDLYVEVNKPHQILAACQKVVDADPYAIVASRIMPSLRNSMIPSCTDITDIGCLMHMGYKTYMVGDDICFKRDSLVSALNILGSVFRDYEVKNVNYTS